jgi:hypothetical protein
VVLAVSDDGYSLKEVIEKNFTDLKLDMRTGFSEIKVDVKEIRKTAEDADEKASAANKRLDNYDKHIMLLWGCLIAAVSKMIFDYLSGGVV